MAKDNKADAKTPDNDIKSLDAKPPKNKKDKKKGKGGLIFLLVLFVIIGGVGAVLYFNVANLREGVLFPQLKKIPIVKDFIPSEETEDDPYSGLTAEQLRGQINQFEDDAAKKDIIIEQLTDSLNAANTEITRLKQFENQQVQFKADKEQFDQMVALNDPKAYSNFYESISPENVERLYVEATKVNIDKAQLRKLVNSYNSMKPGAAALILEDLMLSNMDQVVLILSNMSEEQVAKVIAAMIPANAASITTRMIPEQQEPQQQYTP